MRNYKKIIFSLLALILFLGLFQLTHALTKPVGEIFTITATCSDVDGNLWSCEVTSPCSNICLVSGSSGSCSCQFTCTEVGTYDACGKATDTGELTDIECTPGAVVCSGVPPIADAGPDKQVFEGQSITLDGSGAEDCNAYHCREPDGEGGCQPKAAGENGLPACKTCDGISLNPVNFADNSQDTEGSNLCNQTCEKCSSGYCVKQTVSEDLFDHCEAATCHTGLCSGFGTCGYYSGYWEGPGCTAVCRGCSEGSCVNIPEGEQDAYGSNTCADPHYRCVTVYHPLFGYSFGCSAPTYNQLCCSPSVYCETNCCTYGGPGNTFCATLGVSCACYTYP